MPGDDGTVGVDSYIPAGAPSAISKAVPSSPLVPLQTTFPTEVSPEVLPTLAANAGTGHYDGSSGIVPALLSADSTDVGPEGGSQSVERDTTWPTGDRPIQSAPKEASYGNGIPSPNITRFTILTLFSY